MAITPDCASTGTVVRSDEAIAAAKTKLDCATLEDCNRVLTGACPWLASGRDSVATGVVVSRFTDRSRDTDRPIRISDFPPLAIDLLGDAAAKGLFDFARGWGVHAAFLTVAASRIRAR
jgi:hypothetical protein